MQVSIDRSQVVQATKIWPSYVLSSLHNYSPWGLTSDLFSITSLWIPKPYLRCQLQNHNCLFTPTHLYILAAVKDFMKKEKKKQSIGRPYNIKFIVTTKPQGRSGVGRGEGVVGCRVGWRRECERRAHGWRWRKCCSGQCRWWRRWWYWYRMSVLFLRLPLRKGHVSLSFLSYLNLSLLPSQSKMVQCPEAHLFCSTCISIYAATQLSAHKSFLTCIHPSSYSLPFPPFELKRILSVKLYELYERLEQ